VGVGVYLKYIWIVLLCVFFVPLWCVFFVLCVREFLCYVSF